MRGKDAGLCLLLLKCAMMSGSKEVESVKGMKKGEEASSLCLSSSIGLMLSVSELRQAGGNNGQIGQYLMDLALDSTVIFN